jgi:hypothetical protein
MNIDFSYACATPHRLCTCLPEASGKSLWDAGETGLTLSWSDDDLTHQPRGAWKSPLIHWQIDFSAEADGSVMSGTSWHRVDGWIPALAYTWEHRGVRIEATAVSVKDADVVRLSATNRSATSRTAGVYGAMRKECVNTRWVDFCSPYNALMGHEGERSDRIMLLAVEDDARRPPRSWSHIDVEWSLKVGDTRTAYVVRPQFALLDEIEAWQTRDWEGELASGLEAWRHKLRGMPRFVLPDPQVEVAVRAALADVFVMRERQDDGHVAGVAGTAMYRAANTGEPCFQSMVLNRMGYFAEARDGLEFVLQFQEPDGCWEDHRRWGHHTWGTSGVKSWAIRDHYLFTHDREFLAASFERMLASARWSQRQREKTKVLDGSGRKPLTWGLMPRGMGDCGLMDGDDKFGVFYPHNFLHCFGLSLAVWAAEVLGRCDVLEELRGYHADLHGCLMDSLERGAIQEVDGSRWIPGTPGKTCGSRWGVAEAIAPCGIIPPHHPLADGTMRMLESDISEGGLPVNLGWLKGGVWVAIALDALSYAHLARGNGDTPSTYLYAALNHATPLFTWCEERLPEKGSGTKTGDLQHAWTPIAIARLMRDAMVMEEGTTLHLLRASARQWLSSERPLGIRDAVTHFGSVSFEVRYDAPRKRVEGFVELSPLAQVSRTCLHVRLEEGLKIASFRAQPDAVLDDSRTIISWDRSNGTMSFQADMGPDAHA